MVLYFSGTGNTEYVAKRIAAGIGDVAVDLCDKLRDHDYSEMKSDTPWIICAPTYAWQIPRMVKKWVIKTKLSGNSDIYYVLTCGASVGDAAGYAKAIAEHKGLNYKGLGCVVMPENFYTGLSSPDPKEALEIIENSEESINGLIYYIKHGEELKIEKKESFRGFKSNGFNKLFYRMMRKGRLSDKKFYSTENCIGCGRCVQKCPMANIVLNEEKRPEWQGNCTQCLSCISRCPNGAIEYGKKTVGKDKYFCPKKAD